MKKYCVKLCAGEYIEFRETKLVSYTLDYTESLIKLTKHEYDSEKFKNYKTSIAFLVPIQNILWVNVVDISD